APAPLPPPAISPAPPSTPIPPAPVPPPPASPVAPPPQPPPPTPPLPHAPFPMKKFVIAFVLGIVLTGGVFFVAARMFSDEDTWICTDGKWVKHGNPTAPMPLGRCGSSSSASSMSESSASSIKSSSSTAESSVASSKSSAKAASSQAKASSSAPAKSSAATSSVSSKPAAKTKTYSDSLFAITYPDWPALPPTSILEPDATKIAVTSGGCGLIVTVRALPEGQEFQDFMELLVTEQVQTAGVTITTKEIQEQTMHIVGEFAVGDKTAQTSQYGYLVSNGDFYSVVFAAEKSRFAQVCDPALKAAIKSVKVK
ncbi:MAG: hypothetical protein PHS73_01120, partial [Candidatus Peribacteraceae bacterium]|nr:hypothetical protein [Candidatus Peribacteraceae bacterium]